MKQKQWLHPSLRFRRGSLVAALLSCGLAGAITGSARAQLTFTPLVGPTGGTFATAGVGVSSDGNVVVGQGSSSNGFEAFRWTPGGGTVGLGDLPGDPFFSTAYGVSADGSVVTGVGDQSVVGSAPTGQAFRWTQETGLVGLGDLAGGRAFSIGRGISGDGNTITGYSDSATGTQAFRWTQSGGMVGLGDLPGGMSQSFGFGISLDGNTIVGSGESASGTEAFRWTQATGMVGLGDLAGGAFVSQAEGVSQDGRVIVGQGTSANGSEAFRWTQETGMVALGDLTGGRFASNAFGVSGDGNVIVGRGSTDSTATNFTGNEAFLWTQQLGMVNLQDYLLANFDQFLPADFAQWTLTSAFAISTDGTTIAGSGVNPSGTTQAWRIRNAAGFAPAAVTAPEPSSLALFALSGLPLFGAVLHRRRKS